MTHGTYDEYWQSRNVPKDLHDITHPVLIVASWFDAQDFRGPFRMYRSIEEKNPGNRSTMVIGPWLHGGWARMDGDTLGNIAFGEKTGRVLPPQRRTAVLQLLPKDEGKLALPEVLAFHTGANRWESLDHWPPRGRGRKALSPREWTPLVHGA